MSAADILSKVAKSGGSKKSKVTAPEVNLPKCKDDIKTWLKAAEDEAEAKAKKGEAEAKFLQAVDEARLALCRRDGKHYAAIHVNDDITVSTTNRYSEISTGQRELLESVFGDDVKFLFQTKTSVELTSEAINDENIIAKLVAAVGEENFTRFFSVTQSLTPTELFHTRRSTDPGLSEKADKLIGDGVLRPYKAGVRRM